MDFRKKPWTEQETGDQDEEVLLDPLATDEETLLDPPTPMERGRPQGDAPTDYGEQRREWQAPVEERYPRASVESRRDWSPPVEPRREPPAPVEPLPQRPKKGGMKRWKLLLIALVGIVVISVVLGMFNRAGGSVTVNTTGQSKAQPTSTPVSKRATPTPKVTSTPLVPANVTSGALLLLNPGIVRQGTSMGVTGSGFDPRATVDLAIKQRVSDPGQVLTFVQTDKNGVFTGQLTVPATLTAGPFYIQASERGSNKVAQAKGMIAGGTPQLKLGTQVGKPGDMITVSLHGFSPGETINVYWNTIGGQPVAKLQADGGGGIGQAKVQVPFGAAGVNTFLFVGAKSQSLVASSFFLLSLYPSVKLSSYAIRADTQLSFSGAGFGPGERVLAFLNTTSSQPVAIIQTTQGGTFSQAGSFVVPFVLKGRQTLVFQGEESGASVAVGWTVLPYTPNAQTSTYGGLPGTTVTFYGTGFARNEVVHVYVGHTLSSAGTMVSCFRTDQKGNAGASGSYVIPGDAQGKLTFTLTGSESGGTATATMQVTAAPSPVQVPAQPPFTCPLDSTASQSPSSTSSPSPSQTTTPTPSQTTTPTP